MKSAPKLFRRVRHVHMVGIGGAGMSGIAEVLLNLGFDVTGSDVQLSEVTEHLTHFGARISQGHSADNLAGADVVVYSSAVRPENVEVRGARDMRIPTIPRSEMLAELMRLKTGIAIAGTHGKTTTTSMVGAILQKAELQPTLIVGGKVRALSSGVSMGTGELLIVEADEFDRSFLKLSPTLAVITTIESEHLDTYRDLEDVKDAFVEFANKIPFYGSVIVHGGDPNVIAILPRVKRQVVTYGTDEFCTCRATNIRHRDGRVEFSCLSSSGETIDIRLQIPGEHNVLNALAAITVAGELDIPLNTCKVALEEFTGVHRRFEIKLNSEKLTVVDDYAHHPTEVSMTLQTARHCFPTRRIVALFQPHLYSRTRDFAFEFGSVLKLADVALVADVYPSRERPIEGVTSELIISEAQRQGMQNVRRVEANAIAVRCELSKGDVVVVMGAGSITNIADELSKGAT